MRAQEGGVSVRIETIGRATLIYALSDECSRIRYVGKTVHSLGKRLGQHRRASRRGELPVNRWMRKHDVSIGLLETVGPDQDWASRERHWIEQFSNLLNLTKGGEGLAGHTFSAAHKAKIAEALKTGSHFNCETCDKQFWRKLKDIKQGNCRFCSRRCYAASLKGVSRPVPAICTQRGIEAAAAARRARTHCLRGHPLSGDNMFRTAIGGRGCKECRKIHKATYRSKSHG
jgi:hypothetical protein